MNKTIIASIFRYDPESDKEPYFRDYQVIAQEEISVLVLLNKIHDDLDQTLSFRNYCCGLQMCGSCLMKINHKKRFACLTVVRPGNKLIIEPASYPKGHIKDLVVKSVDKG